MQPFLGPASACATVTGSTPVFQEWTSLGLPGTTWASSEKKMRACRCSCGGQRCKPHRPSSYTDKHWIVCNSHWLNSVSKRKSNYRFTVRVPPCEIITSTLRNVQYYIIFYHVVSHAWFYMVIVVGIVLYNAKCISVSGPTTLIFQNSRLFSLFTRLRPGMS